MASGLVNISARLLKEAAPIVTHSLTVLINLSITTGIFPDAWKQARISHVFKEGLKSDPNNYRPISVLPVVSKLSEGVVTTPFDRVVKYKSLGIHIDDSLTWRPHINTHKLFTLNFYCILFCYFNS